MGSSRESEVQALSRDGLADTSVRNCALSTDRGLARALPGHRERFAHKPGTRVTLPCDWQLNDAEKEVSAQSNYRHPFRYTRQDCGNTTQYAVIVKARARSKSGR